MLDFCWKSGYFSVTRKRHEISMLSEGPSIILGESYRRLLQQKQADPEELEEINEASLAQFTFRNKMAQPPDTMLLDPCVYEGQSGY